MANWASYSYAPYTQLDNHAHNHCIHEMLEMLPLIRSAPGAAHDQVLCIIGYQMHPLLLCDSDRVTWMD
jgi:hypothetical protein